MIGTVYWLTCLVAARILADFPLQTDRLVKNKRKTWGLTFHVAIHGLLSYLLCAKWKMWYLPLLVAVSHVTTDNIKRNHWHLFILDQLLHICVLAGIVFVLPFDDFVKMNIFRVIYFRGLVMMSSLIAITMGSEILIGRIMQIHMKRNNLKLSGLAYGGF